MDNAIEVCQGFEQLSISNYCLWKKAYPTAAFVFKELNLGYGIV
jgi:hypothetical protein